MNPFQSTKICYFKLEFEARIDNIITYTVITAVYRNGDG